MTKVDTYVYKLLVSYVIFAVYINEKLTNVLHKYIQSYIIFLQQHVSVTPAIIISMTYNKKASNVQLVIVYYSESYAYWTVHHLDI